jgi:uncharacterized membrane protein (DUF4010 family)
MDKIKQFFDRNKDWIIQVGGALAVALIVPSLLGGPGRPRKGFNIRSLGTIVQIAAIGYGGYVIYRNWDRIKTELGVK